MSNRPANRPGSTAVSLILGLILILVGILFLIVQIFNITFDLDIGPYIWPFFIIVPGAILFLSAFALERRSGVPLAIFGGMITTTGAILLVQNLTGLWASWAYAWALIAPTSIGVALVIYGGLRGLGDEVRTGLRIALIGLVIFFVAGSFFELVIGISGFRFGLAPLCWPLLLIGLGLVFLVLNLLPRRKHDAS